MMLVLNSWWSKGRKKRRATTLRGTREPGVVQIMQYVGTLERARRLSLSVSQGSRLPRSLGPTSVISRPSSGRVRLLSDLTTNVCPQKDLRIQQSEFLRRRLRALGISENPLNGHGFFYGTKLFPLSFSGPESRTGWGDDTIFALFHVICVNVCFLLFPLSSEGMKSCVSLFVRQRFASGCPTRALRNAWGLLEGTENTCLSACGSVLLPQVVCIPSAPSLRTGITRGEPIESSDCSRALYIVLGRLFCGSVEGLHRT